MLRAHRYEPVTRKQGYAEMSMRAALGAVAFKIFDPDNNKTIEAEDLVRVFASISFADMEDPNVKMDAEKAHALALHILRDQVISGDRRSTGRATGAEAFSFIDYMGTQDNGS